MNEMRALLVAETRLLFRDPITWLAAIALPTVILLIFGSMFGPQEPDPAFGGLRFIDVFVPSLIVITIGTLGIQTLPIRLATYREKGDPAPPVDDAGPPAPAPGRAAGHLHGHRGHRAGPAGRRRERRVRRAAAPPADRLPRRVPRRA